MKIQIYAMHEVPPRALFYSFIFDLLYFSFTLSVFVLLFTCTHDPADTGEVGEGTIRIYPFLVESPDAVAIHSEMKKKTGWHRDEVAPANLLK
jgi:hypothetical protein